MQYNNEELYKTIADLYKRIENINAIGIIAGIIIIATIIAIILIGRENESLSKRIEILENKKSLDKQDRQELK